jgi:cysteinyl-tRNA synthetase
MAAKLLGPAFEIHGGGLDLVFPHHENELAQSRAVGLPFARIWMHNGLLQLTGEKMSKSLGNIATLADVLDEWGRETLLVYFLTGHWRSPIDFSLETLESAREQARTFRNAFLQPPEFREARGWEAFESALEDDFRTPEALAVLHEWRAAGQLELLERGLKVFGLASLVESQIAPPELHELAARRLAARRERGFEEADRLRKEIADAGWDVRDVAGEPGYQLVPRDGA